MDKRIILAALLVVGLLVFYKPLLGTPYDNLRGAYTLQDTDTGSYVNLRKPRGSTERAIGSGGFCSYKNFEVCLTHFCVGSCSQGELDLQHPPEDYFIEFEVYANQPTEIGLWLDTCGWQSPNTPDNCGGDIEGWIVGVDDDDQRRVWDSLGLKTGEWTKVRVRLSDMELRRWGLSLEQPAQQIKGVWFLANNFDPGYKVRNVYIQRADKNPTQPDLPSIDRLRGFIGDVIDEIIGFIRNLGLSGEGVEDLGQVEVGSTIGFTGAVSGADPVDGEYSDGFVRYYYVSETLERDGESIVDSGVKKIDSNTYSTSLNQQLNLEGDYTYVVVLVKAESTYSIEDGWSSYDFSEVDRDVTTVTVGKPAPPTPDVGRIQEFISSLIDLIKNLFGL